LNDKIRKYKVKFGDWDPNYEHAPNERIFNEESDKSENFYSKLYFIKFKNREKNCAEKKANSEE